MDAKEARNPKCSLSDEELVTQCSEWIDKLCKSGGKAWTLRVPVDFNRDPDILFNELINRFKEAKNENIAKNTCNS